MFINVAIIGNSSGFKSKTTDSCSVRWKFERISIFYWSGISLAILFFEDRPVCKCQLLL